tara:strand:- start:416 stop:1243 length:828 start_codon:yes stop_codon:yes gene_type:complete
MKYIIFRIIFLIGFLNLIGCNSRDDQKVFVIAGQSNASGVGDSGKSVFVPNKKVFEYNSLLDTLEVLKDPVGQNHLNFQVAQTGSFIPALAYKYSELSNNEVIIVQAAKGGSSLTAEAEQNNWGNWGKRGKLFSSSLQKTNKALEDSKFKKVDAIFWSQGENDGAAIFLGKISKKVYKTSLKKLIKRFREKFKDVPFIIIETGSFEGDESKSNCYQQIREAQREVAEEMENVYIGYNETEFFIERGWLKDVVHYNQIALNDIGEKLAYFYYSLEN